MSTGERILEVPDENERRKPRKMGGGIMNMDIIIYENGWKGRSAL